MAAKLSSRNHPNQTAPPKYLPAAPILADPNTLSQNIHKKAAAPTLRLLKIIYFSTQPPSIGTFAP